MSNWKCPEDWKCMPKAEDAADGMLMALMFGEHARFQHIRNLSFRRCNASGEMIWPLQKAWCGIVGVQHNNRYVTPGEGNYNGSYKIVWLNNDQYLVQKLKGNI